MKFSLTDNWINIMYNDMHLGRRLFLPNNYKIMLQKFKRDENDLFSDDDFELFTNLLNTLTTNSQIVEVDPTKSIFVKIISGDTSDNIKTVYSTKTANGKNRGIGVAGANSLYVKYVTEFGDMDLNDPDFNDNAKDLIKELRKLSNSDLPKIVENLNLNRKLIELDLKNLPNNLLLQMNKHYEKEHNKHIIQTTFSPI
jgi:5'-3' exonuclease